MQEIKVKRLVEAHAESADKIFEALKDVQNLDWELGEMFIHCEGADVVRRRIDSMYYALAEDLKQGSLLTVLKEMSNLKSLLIPVRLPNEFPVDDLIDLDQLVGQTYWPKLSSVSLSGFKATAEQLQAFLLRHRDTLVSVKIGEAYLTHGEWDECFRSLAGRLPKLEQFKLYETLKASSGRMYSLIGNDPSDIDNRQRFSKYLIKGGPRLPGRPLRYYAATAQTLGQASDTSSEGDDDEDEELESVDDNEVDEADEADEADHDSDGSNIVQLTDSRNLWSAVGTGCRWCREPKA